MAEGAPLLREYRVKSLIEGSNPSLSARYAIKPLFLGAFLLPHGFRPDFRPYAIFACKRTATGEGWRGFRGISRLARR